MWNSERRDCWLRLLLVRLVGALVTRGMQIFFLSRGVASIFQMTCAPHNRRFEASALLRQLNDMSSAETRRKLLLADSIPRCALLMIYKLWSSGVWKSTSSPDLSRLFCTFSMISILHRAALPSIKSGAKCKNAQRNTVTIKGALIPPRSNVTHRTSTNSALSVIPVTQRVSDMWFLLVVGYYAALQVSAPDTLWV